MNRRILVTGSSGFIGGHLVAELLRRGYDVIGVDRHRFPIASEEACHAALCDSMREGQRPARYEHHVLDIRRTALLGDLGRVFGVVHLAALTGVRASLEDPVGYFDTNVLGTLNVLDIARRIGAEKVVVASTSSVYGEQAGPWAEHLPMQPRSPYAASKAAMEFAVAEWQARAGIGTDILRFFTVYGPRGRRDMLIGRACEDIWKGRPVNVFGDGNARRDWTYVADTVRGVTASLEDTTRRLTTINLGSGSPVSVNELMSAMMLASGCEVKMVYSDTAPGDVPETWADRSRALELLGWKPECTLDHGLRLTWEAALKEMQR